MFLKNRSNKKSKVQRSKDKNELIQVLLFQENTKKHRF